MQEVAEEMGAQVRDWAQEKGSQIKEGAQEAMQQVGASASQLAEMGRTTMNQLEGSLEDQNPPQAAAICAYRRRGRYAPWFTLEEIVLVPGYGRVLRSFREHTKVRRWRYLLTFVCRRLSLCASYSEVDCLPCLGTADHRLSPLHVMHTGFKGDHRDLLRPPNRIGKLFLYAVVSLCLGGLGTSESWVSPRRPAKTVCF